MAATMRHVTKTHIGGIPTGCDRFETFSGEAAKKSATKTEVGDDRAVSLDID